MYFYKNKNTFPIVFLHIYLCGNFSISYLYGKNKTFVKNTEKRLPRSRLSNVIKAALFLFHYIIMSILCYKEQRRLFHIKPYKGLTDNYVRFDNEPAAGIPPIKGIVFAPGRSCIKIGVSLPFPYIFMRDFSMCDRSMCDRSMRERLTKYHTNITVCILRKADIRRL